MNVNTPYNFSANNSHHTNTSSGNRKENVQLVDDKYQCFTDYYSVYIEPRVNLNLKEFQIMQECYYAECKHLNIIGLQEGQSAQFWADRVISIIYRR
jgi:hypothetical protein